MPKGIPNKQYTPEFKKQVVEAVIQDGLSYREAARIYEVQGHGRIESWERIYLEEVLPFNRLSRAFHSPGVQESLQLNCTIVRLRVIRPMIGALPVLSGSLFFR